MFGVAGAINECNTLRTFLEFMTALLIAGTTMLCEVWQSPRCFCGMQWNRVFWDMFACICSNVLRVSQFVVFCGFQL